MDKRKPKRIKTKESILVLCEGDTEFSYVKDVIPKGLSIAVERVGGGGYAKIINFIERRQKFFSVILVVCDLDRAVNIPNEQSVLSGLIRKLQEVSSKNNIFLTYESIEYWFACGLGLFEGDYLASLSQLGYKKGSSVAQWLQEKQFSAEDAKNACCRMAREEYYFYKDTPGKRCSPNKQNLEKRQSTVWMLLDYIKKCN